MPEPPAEMPEPPVIITGGSINIRLNGQDFPTSPQDIRGVVRIAGVRIREEDGKETTINFPNGRFTVTFLRTPEGGGSK